MDVKGEVNGIIQLAIANGDSFNTGNIANTNSLYQAIGNITNNLKGMWSNLYGRYVVRKVAIELTFSIAAFN